MYVRSLGVYYALIHKHTHRARGCKSIKARNRPNLCGREGTPPRCDDVVLLVGRSPWDVLCSALRHCFRPISHRSCHVSQLINPKECRYSHYGIVFWCESSTCCYYILCSQPELFEYFHPLAYADRRSATAFNFYPTSPNFTRVTRYRGISLKWPLCLLYAIRCNPVGFISIQDQKML